MALTGPFSGWMRNYEAMGDAKLLRALEELRGQQGDAFGRVQNRGGMLFEHLREAEAIARSRNLTDGPGVSPDADAKTMGVLTEPMECAECGRVERHFEDDYMCRVCRNARD
jgi:hypothetical protein